MDNFRYWEDQLNKRMQGEDNGGTHHGDDHPPRLGIYIALAAIFLLISFSSKLVGLYIDYLWYVEVGRADVFIRTIGLKLGLFITAFIFIFGFVAGNIYLAKKMAPRFRMVSGFQLLEFAKKFLGKMATIVLYGGTFVIALMMAFSATKNWSKLLLYLGKTDLGMKDPIFGVDASFYMFNFPIYQSLIGFLTGAVVLGALGAFLSYASSGGITLDPVRGKVHLQDATKKHLLILLGLGLFLRSADYSLQAYGLLSAPNENGAGVYYTELHATIPGLKILSFLALVAGALVIFFALRNKFRAVMPVVVSMVLFSFVLGVLYPAAINKFIVLPNQLALEKPFIKSNVEFTQEGFALTDVDQGTFPSINDLTVEKLVQNKDAVNNIRIWDWRPLLATYSQIQEIRSYYSFNDVDVDRYRIGSADKQFMLAARELDTEGLSPNARTWVNEHLVYTHGYGAVASPVTEITSEGLPDLSLKDIPPVTSNKELLITRPEIYFGERQNDYFFVKTEEKEFDYPKGDQNVFSTYKGDAGIPVKGLFRKALFAWHYGDLKILLTGSINPESRIVIRSNIQKRVKEVAPFLVMDKDPYTVISDGKLYWMMDTYTVSKNFPYSTQYSSINYIRNSIKVVVDAYNGDMSFYIYDDKDPIARSLQKNFPDMFKKSGEMPADLATHVRYPVDFFSLQAQVYATYHMEDPQTFYNLEDAWAVPQEIFQNTKQLMEPYYSILKIPGEKINEFALLLPMVVNNKNNMVAWFAARMDGEHYGELKIFKLPKDKLTFGPLQIEARIEQDPEISKQLSLWRQRGSEVIRGNLLVIPIENSFLYVEPLYLQAEQSQLPELKKVVVVYGSKVSMEDNLPTALSKIFGRETLKTFKVSAASSVNDSIGVGSKGEGEGGQGAVPASGDAVSDDDDDQGAEDGSGGQATADVDQSGIDDATTDLAGVTNKISDAFEKAEQAQKQGDWAEYGRQIKNLEDAIAELKRLETE